MKKLKEKYITLCNKVKLYLCELKKKDIKFSDIVKFLFKILVLVFLFCVLGTTIFKSCSNSNQNHFAKNSFKRSKNSGTFEDLLGYWVFNDEVYNTSHPKGSGTYEITFISNGLTFETLQDDIEDGFLYYGDQKVYSNFSWLDTTFKKIEIVDVNKLLTDSEVDPSFPTFNNGNVLRLWLQQNAIFIPKDTNTCPPCQIPWCYDGKRNGIYKFSDTLFSKNQILTLLFDFSSYGGNFNKLMVNKGVLSFGNDTETYQVALFNADTYKWEFSRNEDRYINLRHFQTENDYIQFDLQLIKGNILENISFQQFQKETAKTAFDAGVDLTLTTNNSIVLFFTQLFQLPYMIFTTLFSPFTFELGGISINLGATLLGLMLVLLIVWVMKKFK